MPEFNFFHPEEIRDEQICRVSVVIRFREKWLFISSNGEALWDVAEDDRYENESLLECCKRITSFWSLDENAVLKPVCPYSVKSGEKIYYGMLYFLSTDRLNDANAESFRLFDCLPENLSRPVETKRLFTGTQGWLNMQTNADELWDVYDSNRRLTGKLHRRGDFLKKGEYHLVVHVWLLNSKGEFLLTKRAPNKGFPNTWETSGGAAQTGDDSLSAAIREVYEETGLVALPENAEQIFTFRRKDDFCDVWLIRQDFDLEKVVLLPGETIDKKYASASQILEMYQNKELVPYSYLGDFFSKIFS